MANQIPKSDGIKELAFNLTSDRINLINFDQLKERLISIDTKLEKADKVDAELSLLRQDYINRISGMVKAIAAVERGRFKTAEALVYLEGLIELNASELIDEYRKTSARFRSAFPTTFGLNSYHSIRSNNLKNPEVYK